MFSIFDNLPYRVYVRDKNRHIVYANKLVEDFFGHPLKFIIGRQYEEIFKDEGFIEYLNKADKILFYGNTNSFTTVKEFNRYYHKESIFKVIDFICEQNEQKFIATILVEITDTYSVKSGINLGIGFYDPANRVVRLNTGENVVLTSLENSLLFMLYEKHGEILGYDEIFIGLELIM